MDTRTLIAIGAGLTAFLGVQSWVLWRLLRSLTTVQRLDEKLGHFGDALSLLTETTETGFRALATELDRLPHEAAGKKPAGATALSVMTKTSGARISAAARRGRTVSEIAAAEQLSEGEVRLRLHLAKQAAQAKSTTTAVKESAPKESTPRESTPRESTLRESAFKESTLKEAMPAAVAASGPMAVPSPVPVSGGTAAASARARQRRVRGMSSAAVAAATAADRSSTARTTAPIDKRTIAKAVAEHVIDASSDRLALDTPATIERVSPAKLVAERVAAGRARAAASKIAAADRALADRVISGIEELTNGTVRA